MKATRFQTDKRLWILIAVVLFASSWCFPLIDIKGPPVRPVLVLWDGVVAIVHGDSSMWGALGLPLVMFACLSGIAAAVFGWMFQCLVVIVRSR